MEKVLVTGISGFLGHHCASELLKNGYYVKGSLREMNKKDEVLNGLKKEVDSISNLEFVKLDLLVSQKAIESISCRELRGL